ncbi:MAG: hypothetical protein Greene041662_134 [Candidatus Peregrinibacteria bacterium Greene0416_62]|nr:MAG: hypothetical protein Greene041662_134 [Candidatus Peregrinibacteria bacterium Greene0416_62]
MQPNESLESHAILPPVQVDISDTALRPMIAAILSKKSGRRPVRAKDVSQAILEGVRSRITVQRCSAPDLSVTPECIVEDAIQQFQEARLLQDYFHT